jgi:hypothetical protein
MTFWNTLKQALHAFTQVRPAFALAAASLYIISLFLGGARWRKVLEGLGAESRLWHTSAGVLIGLFVNNVTPSSRIGGEVSRVALIRKWANIDVKKATVSVFYDRLTMIIPLIFLVAVSFPVLRQMIGHLQMNRNYISMAIGIAVLTALGLLSLRYVRRLREWILEKRKIIETIQIKKKQFIEATGFAFLIWIQDVLRLMLVAAAFGVILNPYQAATLSLVLLLCSFVPSIGGVGPTEGGLMAVLHLFGITLDTAIAITVLERSISYVLSIGIGSLTVAALGGKKILQKNAA